MSRYADAGTDALRRRAHAPRVHGMAVGASLDSSSDPRTINVADTMKFVGVISAFLVAGGLLHFVGQNIIASSSQRRAR